MSHTLGPFPPSLLALGTLVLQTKMQGANLLRCLYTYMVRARRPGSGAAGGGAGPRTEAASPDAGTGPGGNGPALQRSSRSAEDLRWEAAEIA